MRALWLFALGVPLCAGCADVAATAYDAGAVSPVGQGTDAGGPRVTAPDAGVATSGDDASIAVSDDGGASGAPVPAADGGVPTPLPGGAAAWLSQVVYLVMPDRFQNGDPTNDDAGTPSCFDPTDPKKFHGGDLAGLRQRIPYLQDLGVTAVWITPQYRQSSDRCGYHGYWAGFTDPDDGAMEPKMGTPADLSGLANDLHAAGMRLVLDMVVNHSGIGAPVVTQQPTWFHNPSTCSSLGDPNVYCPVGGKPLPDFAQENPVVASYLTAMSVGWMTRFGIDGIRMDTVKNVLPAYWAASWFPAIRAAFPGVFVVGEDFDESGTTGLLAYLNDGFDSLFDYPAYPAIVSTFAQAGAVDALANAVALEISTYGLQRALQMERFVDNHDNPRLTSQFPSGTSDADVAARFKLAMVALFTLPGIPEVMWGDEIAMYGAADPDNRRDMPSWAWTAGTRAGAHAGMGAGDGQAAYAHLQSLIATRKAHVALQQGSYAEEWRQNGGAANVFAYHRGSGSDHVITAINVGAAASVSLPITASHALSAGDKAALPDGTVLKDVLGEGAPATVTVAGGVLPIALPAQTAGIYVLP
jgi:glycosidase